MNSLCYMQTTRSTIDTTYVDRILRMNSQNRFPPTDCYAEANGYDEDGNPQLYKASCSMFCNTIVLE